LKVLFIHQVFVTTAEPGGTRHFEFGRYLITQGDSFTVIASPVNYLTGKRTHPEQHAPRYQEQIEGIKITRAYTPQMLHKNFLTRLLTHWVFALVAAWEGLRTPQIDLVIGTTPPFFQPLSAWIVARLRRKPLLLEVRDLWPEFAIDMGVLRNRLIIFLARRLERFFYCTADHLLVNSPAYQDYLIHKGIPPEKISLIPSGTDTTMFTPDQDGSAIRARYGLEGKFVIVYTGALGLANDLDLALQAADQLRGYAHIHFLLVGDGKERARLEAESVRMGLTNVTFTGALLKRDMPAVLAAADLGLVTLLPIKMFTTTYPNKVFDYMAAGIPTLLAVDGVIRQVIDASESGIFVTPGDSIGLSKAILRLCDDYQLRTQLGQNARAYVVKHFDRQTQAKAFYALCHTMTTAAK